MKQKCKGENNIQIQICEVNKEENYKLKDTLIGVFFIIVFYFNFNGYSKYPPRVKLEAAIIA